MKKITKILSAVLIFLLLFSLIGCNTPDDGQGNRSRVRISGTIYSIDTQILTIKAVPSERNPIFKANISKSDIVLGDALENKTLEKVEFVSDKEIRITLSGAVEKFEGDKASGDLTIKASAIENGRELKCTLNVYNPTMTLSVEEVSGSGTPANKTIRCEYILPYGKFNLGVKVSDFTVLPADSDLGLFAPTPNGTVSHVVASGRILRMTITGFDSTKSEYPKVIFSEGITSFNISLTVEVGKNEAISLVK